MIYARAPLRLSLAGGGSDLSPFRDIHGGRVLNVAINLFSTVAVGDELKGGECALSEAVKFFLTQSHPAINGKPWPGNKRWQDVPYGSGLGGSSSTVVALLAAYWAYWSDKGYLASFTKTPMAHTHWSILIERTIAQIAGGMQDACSAVHGGLNVWLFNGAGIAHQPVPVPDALLSLLESSMLLVWTGSTRPDTAVVQQQTKRILSGEHDAMEATHDAKRSVDVWMKLVEEWMNPDRSMDASYYVKARRTAFAAVLHSLKCQDVLKRRMCPEAYTPDVEAAIRDLYVNGACHHCSYKLVGAGAGGFLLVMAEPEVIHEIDLKMREVGRDTALVRFCQKGVQVWQR